MPVLSVVVPIYNVAPHLSRCLQSVAEQTYRDFECLLIDDGSTDGSFDICQNLVSRDCRFIVIHQENGGVSSARNQGIDHARGEYITFVDADDYLDPCHFEYLLGCPAADLVVSGIKRTDSDIRCEIQESNTSYTKEGSIQLLHALYCRDYLFGSTCNKIFRRSIISQYLLRFDERFSFREDELFVLNYCQYITSLQILASNTYHYHIHHGSLSTSEYYSPELLIQVAALSREYALKLPLSDSFRCSVQEYYTDTLVWAFRLAYRYPHLASSSLRYYLLEILMQQANVWPTKASRQVLFPTSGLTTLVMYHRYYKSALAAACSHLL